MTLPTSCPQCQSWFRPRVQQSSKCLCVPHPHCIFSCRGPWVPLEEDSGRGLPWTLWSLPPRGSAPLQAMSSASKDRLRSGNRARDCDFLLLGPPSAVGWPGLDFCWCTLRHALVCFVDSSPRVQALCGPGTAAALQPAGHHPASWPLLLGSYIPIATGSAFCHSFSGRQPWLPSTGRPPPTV